MANQKLCSTCIVRQCGQSIEDSFNAHVPELPWHPALQFDAGQSSSSWSSGNTEGNPSLDRVCDGVYDLSLTISAQTSPIFRTVVCSRGKYHLPQRGFVCQTV